MCSMWTARSFIGRRTRSRNRVRCSLRRWSFRLDRCICLNWQKLAPVCPPVACWCADRDTFVAFKHERRIRSCDVIAIYATSAIRETYKIVFSSLTKSAEEYDAMHDNDDLSSWHILISIFLINLKSYCIILYLAKERFSIWKD